MPLTKVTKSLITSVDVSQINTTVSDAGKVLTSDGSTLNWVVSSSIGSTGITRGTAVTASGTAVDFTGIPSTAIRVTIMYSALSNSNGSAILAQIGSGSIDATGYNSSLGAMTGSSSYAGASTTSGFALVGGSVASSSSSGTFTICLIGSYIYAGSGTNARPSENNAGFAAGSKTLTGPIDRVRITMNGTSTFDAGTINIMWE